MRKWRGNQQRNRIPRKESSWPMAQAESEGMAVSEIAIRERGPRTMCSAAVRCWPAARGWALSIASYTKPPMACCRRSMPPASRRSSCRRMRPPRFRIIACWRKRCNRHPGHLEAMVGSGLGPQPERFPGVSAHSPDPGSFLRRSLAGGDAAPPHAHLYPRPGELTCSYPLTISDQEAQITMQSMNIALPDQLKRYFCGRPGRLWPLQQR